MHINRQRASTAGNGDALKIAVHSQANTDDITLNLAFRQANFVARRMRLRPDLARVVADHVFGRSA